MITHDVLERRGALPANLFAGNGYGRLVGATQVRELGEVETTVLLTSTLSAFRVADALVTWVLERAPIPPTSLDPVVGEIDDAWLSYGEPRAVGTAYRGRRFGEHLYARPEAGSGARRRDDRDQGPAVRRGRAQVRAEARLRRDRASPSPRSTCGSRAVICTPGRGGQCQ
ncbi:P1 family peptidase [Nonomuraea pusilla]|uniref:P1 family peptidase n=1 Tax=Nonomuraea pusilla TaxID=46177 RepID=UPI000B1D7AF2|nr:P1 family peptidase [Nonomuraea pusilla]